LFKDSDEARSILDGLLPADLLELVVATLVPVIGLLPIGGDDPDALTRIGGTPVMAAEIAWPAPRSQRRPEDFSDYGEEIVTHVRSQLPLGFVGQVDLAAVPGALDAAGDLPREGRLLFFYDFIVGPFENGDAFSRVIWDPTPAETAIVHPFPAAFVPAEEAYAKQVIEAFKAYDLQATDADLRAPFRAPLRAAEPRSYLSRLGDFTVEFQQHTALSEMLERDEAAQQAYEELDYALELAQGEGPLPSMFLLGVPVPEQDDPRYDAVVITRFGEQHLSSEAWDQHRDQIMRDAADWRLLAQVGFAEWHGTGEGTVYFLIRAEDLAARRFDTVIAVYQQT
jgi:uncharacterized protein YwqG